MKTKLYKLTIHDQRINTNPDDKRDVYVAASSLIAAANVINHHLHVDETLLHAKEISEECYVSQWGKQ